MNCDIDRYGRVCRHDVLGVERVKRLLEVGIRSDIGLQSTVPV